MGSDFTRSVIDRGPLLSARLFDSVVRAWASVKSTTLRTSVGEVPDPSSCFIASLDIVALVVIVIIVCYLRYQGAVWPGAGSVGCLLTADGNLPLCRRTRWQAIACGSCAVTLSLPRGGLRAAQASMYRSAGQVCDADLRRHIHKAHTSTTGAVRAPTEVRRADGQRQPLQSFLDAFGARPQSGAGPLAWRSEYQLVR